MYKNKSFLAVIPARGGSKGLPKKNILPFMGRPLFVHSYDEAKKSKYLDRIVLSTEDPEIKAISVDVGLEVIDRPQEFAEDASPTEDALIHASNYLIEKEGKNYDYIVTLQATCPLRTAATIDRGIETIMSDDFDSLISCKAVYDRFGRKKNNSFELIFPGQPIRRQDREPLYHADGVLFITSANILKKEKFCSAGKIAILVPPENESYDIDSLLDFKIAETVYYFNNNPNSLK